MSHGHSHGGGACASEAGDADHSHDVPVDAHVALDSLYKCVDVDGVRCLNEAEPNMGRRVFRPHDERLDRTRFLRSDDDDAQLLLHVPFVGQVKLKSFTLIPGDGGEAPNHVAAWTNRDDIDFSNADDVKPVQRWELAAEDRRGEIDYPMHPAKFSNVSSLTLLVDDNHGAPTTCIYYLAFKGEHSAVRREAVLTSYESKPQLSDHKTQAEDGGRSYIN